MVTRSNRNHQELRRQFPQAEILCFDELETIAEGVLILAVKPQDFGKMMESARVQIDGNVLVLSIMAGITLSEIQRKLRHKRVVRAMPNAPSLVGAGVTGYFPSAEIDVRDLLQIERLLSCTGISMVLDNEAQLDSVTALSGSGPAYFYYIVDAMIQAGKTMGLDENVAKQFVKQTMLGAYYLIQNSEKDLSDLISDVASRGGTTEAALRHFEQQHLAKILSDGILAAEARSKELSAVTVLP